ncbi:MAG: hypothetical protein U0Q15_06880 [Kineosporiaceae bacterium]
MKVLLDEQVPVQFLEPMRHILRGHAVEHVTLLGWAGKPDVRLLPDARKDGFDAIVTNDRKQLADPDECRAIKRSGLHHITFTVGNGLDGLALALASLVAAVRYVIADLEDAEGQRLVTITALSRRPRHTTIDPAVAPPSYWPGGRRA